MPTHRLFLRGPWGYRCLSSEPTSCPSSGKVQFPADWQQCFADWWGTVEFTRVFHAPTNLDPHETVAVIFTGVGGHGTVWVNDHCLGTISSSIETQRFEIRPWLQPTNLLRVEFRCESPAQTCVTDPALRLGLWNLVGLEITS